MKELLGTIAIILVFIGYIPYIRDILHGKTKPHAYTWFVWSLLTFLIFALQFSDGAGIGGWITFAVGLITSLIFLLSLRFGTKDITRTDTIMLVFAGIALLLWFFADSAQLAITLLVLTDMFGFIPTVRKSWNRPEQETFISYLIGGMRHGLSFFALQRLTYVTMLFPVVWSVANFLFVMMLIIRRKQMQYGSIFKMSHQGSFCIQKQPFVIIDA